MRVHKRLVPLGLQTFFDSLCSSFAFITDESGQQNKNACSNIIDYSIKVKLGFKTSYGTSIRPFLPSIKPISTEMHILEQHRFILKHFGSALDQKYQRNSYFQALSKALQLQMYTIYITLISFVSVQGYSQQITSQLQLLQ